MLTKRTAVVWQIACNSPPETTTTTRDDVGVRPEDYEPTPELLSLSEATELVDQVCLASERDGV